HWVIDADGDYHMGYHGDPAALAFYRGKVAALEPRGVREVADLADDCRHRADLWPAMRAKCRISVPPSRIDEFLKLAGLTARRIDPVFGIILPGQAPDVDSGKLAWAARQVGGSAWFTDDSGRLSQISIDAGAYAILQRLKHAFDPDCSLPPLPANLA
ncbi:MAG: hypothetical protein NZ561_08930, partial [Phycisphaerae bacterium]|nr:hypothetical protein [Phycisphaerae bacterium]